jgi:polyhydroxyalkanoate synthesis regulator phasin
MTGSPVLKRLLDTGLQYSEMSQKNAEKLVADFVKAGQVRRKDAEKTVQRLVERGRTTSEHIVGLIQSELAKQLGNFAQRLDDIEARVEDVAGGFGIGSKAPSTVVRKAATAVKKSPAKKAAAKKSPAKKAAAKKSPAKKAAGPSGVAKVVARKAPAKKAAAKK